MNVTSFQETVYEACSQVPRGKVTTYARLARNINCRSPRAVGQALKRNPFAPEVPCHRVVKSDRTLGGFSGKTEGEEVVRKRKLLQKEGVEFEEDGRISEACIL